MRFVGIIYLIPLAVWIYLVWMVRTKKTSLFHDQIEPKLAERHYKRLKTFLLVGGISLGVGIIGIVGHNAVYAVSETEEAVFLSITLAAILVFFIATVGGLVIFLKGRRKTTRDNTEGNEG